jgi:phosphoenolpyruvate-protein phosphotransferase (PTS system enzyme I)
MVDEKIQFIGITAYPGVIYAKCKKVKSYESSPSHHRSDLNLEERNLNASLFLEAIHKTEADIQNVIQECRNESGGIDLVEILNSQKEILNDPMLKDGVLDRIRNNGECAGLALENTVQRIYDEFIELEDEFFRDRADHIQDIGKRLSQNINNPNHSSRNTLELKEPAILVAKDISPSELISLDKSKILGIATDHGGKTGHMAIIARNYGIPTIVGLKNFSTFIDDGEFLLLDAERGFIKRNASIEEFKSFGERCLLPLPSASINQKPLATMDGTRVFLKANLETDEDCDDVIKKKAEGIGLYRSEILYIQLKSHTPTEEEQYKVYKNILKSMKDMPVVIRVFDIGADKYEVGSHEANPFLGNRGIRYLLRHTNLFKEQLRALLRASTYGKLNILIPMVSSISEVLDTKKLLQESMEELNSEGIEYSKEIAIGIMVETPACALGLDEFLKHVDFISVGTNDLLQYTMAVERNNYAISSLYNPFHFVFLELLEQIVTKANKKKKPVSICGEIATDPDMTGILLAMGYRDLSVAPPFLPLIQDRIRTMKLKKQKSLYKTIKSLAREEKFYEIELLLKEDVL